MYFTPEKIVITGYEEFKFPTETTHGKALAFTSKIILILWHGRIDNRFFNSLEYSSNNSILLIEISGHVGQFLILDG